MRVGSVVFATKSGLGILAKSFYDHGIVDEVMLVTHPHYTTHPDWYPRAVPYGEYNVNRFLSDIDVLLIFENALNWSIAERARQKKIKIVLMPMYEWTPCPLPVPIDLFLCPSKLDLGHYDASKSVLVTVPVEVPWKLRTEARIFVHNAGHGGTNFRNGTPDLLEAMRYVKSPIKLIVRGQPGIECQSGRCRGSENRVTDLFRKYDGYDDRVEFRLGNASYTDLWNEGDVFIFPERFNGLSLPLQEAFASGMLVMSGDRFPMNTWLPQSPLIPIEGYTDEKLAVSFKAARFNPQTIAKHIDSWYRHDIENFSRLGHDWSERNSWEVLKPRYLELLGANP